MSPQDIQIAEGGPQPRRRYLDMVLSYQDPDYLQQLLLYNRALRQRNAVLKKIKKREARLDDLETWNAGLVEYAEKITRSRQRFVAEFEGIFQDSLERISSHRDKLRLRLIYSSSQEEEDYAGALRRHAPRDASLGFTSVGPHRQNLGFEQGSLDITRFGSQGQKRSLVLALRIAQFSFLRRNLGLAPILLIDDVIRELDAGRRGAFVELLKESGQAIFTTPDLDGMDSYPGDLKADTRVLYVSEPGQADWQS